MTQKLQKPEGWLDPMLYDPVVGSGSFHDITSGNVDAYSAGLGGDACTG